MNFLTSHTLLLLRQSFLQYTFLYSLIYVFSCAFAQFIFQTSTEFPPDVNQKQGIPILHPASHFEIQMHSYCYYLTHDITY